MIPTKVGDPPTIECDLLYGLNQSYPMVNWKPGDLVEVDGLLAIVVATTDVPDGHVAVWFGEPRCVRRSQGGNGGEHPEIWTVPADYVTAAATPIVKH